MQNSDVKQHCHPYTAWQKILLCCYCTDKSLDVCIFARFEVNCEVMLLRSFAIFRLIMSRHRKELRGALGLCVNPSLGEEVDGLDIGGQHGPRFALLRNIHKPQSRSCPICVSRSR